MLDFPHSASYTAFEMIIDLHNHTCPLSPCSYLTPGELVQRAKELGLDGVCLTEHDKIWPEEEAVRLADEHDFLVLRGVEVTTDIGHVLVFGLNQLVLGISSIRRLREVVTAAGGVMILAHPSRNQPVISAREDLSSIFDAIEVMNGADFAPGIAAIWKTGTTVGLKETGGSDAHALREVGLCATAFEDEIRDEKDLVEALRGNGYHALRLR